jgi:hypothetical protein
MMELDDDDASIGADEIVFRRVAQSVYDENLQRHRPSTQSFKQDGPYGLVSVYLSSETTAKEVANGGPEPYLVCLEVAVLRKAGLGIVRSNSSGGAGHCDITGKKTKGRLNKIVRSTEWVEGYSP